MGGLGLRGGFDHGPFGGHRGLGLGHGILGEAAAAVASYLGITTDELHTQLESGKTLAQIAVAHNKTADGVVTTLLANAKQRLDTAVADQRLTADQEQAFLDRLKTMLTDVVNGQRPTMHEFRIGRPGVF